MAAAVSAVFSLHSLPTRTTSIVSRERVKFNKVSLLYRNVSSGARGVSIRALDTTKSRAKTSKDTKKNIEGLAIDEYTPENPYIGKCLHTIKITEDDAPGEIWHIIINTNGEIHYREGQYVGVIPDGNHKNLKNLFSVASSARGDFGNFTTVSLCVKRSFNTNDQGLIVPGITSNYLCNLIPGDEVKLTGPGGVEMLMPIDPNATIIMLATDTGIAPFRSFLWKMFFNPDDAYKFNGLGWLFYGAPTNSSLVYREELRKMKETYPDKLRLDFAVGEKMNIPTRMAQYGEELWELIKNKNAYVYMSGNKNMEEGIENFMSALTAKHGEDWSQFRGSLRKEGRWNVEVY